MPGVVKNCVINRPSTMIFNKITNLLNIDLFYIYNVLSFFYYPIKKPPQLKGGFRKKRGQWNAVQTWFWENWPTVEPIAINHLG